LELAEETKLESARNEYVSLAIDAAKGLMAICNNVLDLSKFEAGKVALDDEDFSIRELITTLGSQFRAVASEKKVAVVWSVDRDVPEQIQGDKNRLQQILTNLISNAVKFTDHGQVSISVNMETESDSAEPKIRFNVTDTGIGIPSEYLGEIFDSFTQARNADFVRGGTGLGLAISNYLVALMGGRIDVQSELGAGSIFSFDMRLKRASSNRAFGNNSRSSVLVSATR
jgi:signal transduction histidine kinase